MESICKRKVVWAIQGSSATVWFPRKKCWSLQTFALAFFLYGQTSFFPGKGFEPTHRVTSALLRCISTLAGKPVCAYKPFTSASINSLSAGGPNTLIPMVGIPACMSRPTLDTSEPILASLKTSIIWEQRIPASTSNIYDEILTARPLRRGEIFLSSPENCLGESIVLPCICLSNSVRLPRSCSASFASSAAFTLSRPTSLSLFVRSSEFLLRKSLSMEKTLMPTPSSPITPPEMNRTLSISITNLFFDGLSGRRIVPSFHFQVSSRCSSKITQNSIITPNATRPVNPHSQCSQGNEEMSKALISLSNADMELSRAKESVGKFEAAWIRCAKIAIILLFVVMAYGITLIILALSDD